MSGGVLGGCFGARTRGREGRCKSDEQLRAAAAVESKVHVSAHEVDVCHGESK